MSAEYTKPSEIERASFAIIRQELDMRGVILPPEHRPVVERVIHTTADFDYAENLTFTEDAVSAGIAALRRGVDIITDTNMARAGISAPGMARLGGEVHCYMADPAIARDARTADTTRAAASMRYAAAKHPCAIFAVGNAPTALMELVTQMEDGFRPALVAAVPVGFVNVAEAKERILAACITCGVPAIVARGRKGGSGVACAVMNALIYAAADMQDPARRGWN